MNPFETRGFPARWNCGTAWTEQPWLAWLHIGSDVLTSLAYFAVPIVVLYFVSRRNDLRFPPIFYVFLGGIFLTCGTGHLVEAIIFWSPVYRFAGWLKLATAIVSCAGVVVLVRILPRALELKRPTDVQREVEAREQAQSALKHEQFLFRTLLEQLPDAIYFKDRDGRFLRVSQALARHLGCADPSGVIGRTDADFFPAKYSESARADEIHVMESRQPIVGREEHPLWRGGGEAYVSTTKCPLIAADGSILGTLGISHDITVIKEQETALAASEERYALAVQGSSDGLWDWTIPTGDVYYSPRYKQLLGYHDDEFPNQLESFSSHLHSADYVKSFAAVRAHLERKVPYDVTYRLRTKSGEYRWFRARGQALWNPTGRASRMAGSISDITEQYRAEARFRLAVEASPSGMLIVDKSGNILLANSQITHFFGYTEKELLGSSVDKLVPDRFQLDHPRMRAEFFENPRKRVIGADRDMTARRKDGTEFDIEIGLSPLQTENGPAVLCSVIDITERKQNLRALQAAKEAAEAANRAKSDFLANISHEIRTPMNAIIGMTELVLDTRLAPVQRSYLSTVAESADSLLEIINEILDFSKIESGHIELETVPFSLRETIGDALKALAVRANAKDLELAWQVANDVPEVFRGDPTRLRQIVVNLVGNAIKFTNKGEVVVRVEQEKEPSSGELHISVSDTGIGIPANRQKAIFDPFTQADMSTTRQFGGTGLGLTISSSLVKLMGGRIWLESEVGRGSRFHFTLRLEPAGPDDITISDRRFATPQLQGVRVLVVDDNATNCQILTEMLTAWGLAPHSVNDATIAYEWLQQETEAGRPVALVITDLHMPRKDGFQLIASIRMTTVLAETPIILLTSGHRPGDIARCEKLGLSANLNKPVKQSELLKAISLALAHLPNTAASRPAEKHFSGPDIPPLRILLAEDGLANQRLAVGLLSKWGHTVTIANNGQEAVQQMASGHFDLVLMDINMPELDGLEATQQIRRHEAVTGGHIPIIAMTAHALKGDREKCLASGMDGYVSKPVHQSELANALSPFFTPASETPTHETPARQESTTANDEVRSGSGPCVDWGQALTSVNQDEDLLRSVIAAAQDELPKLLDQLTKALAEGSVADVQRGAHTIKSSARLFGVVPLAELCEELECRATTEDLSFVSTRIPELKSMIETMVQELVTHFNYH